MSHCHAEQVGPLRHAGTYEQTAVGTANDGNLVLVGVFVADEGIPGCTDEIIKHVLLVHLGSGEVPFLPIFATAAQVGNCQDAAILDKWYVCERVGGLNADVETAVAI